MTLNDKWTATRERRRQQREAELAQWRRVAKVDELQDLGVPVRDLRDLPEESLDEMIATERQRQAGLFEATAQEGAVAKFGALGVQVVAGDDDVYTIGYHDSHDRIDDSRVLGPLAGAVASVTESTSAFSPCKALLMPAPAAALARKEIADAMVTFTDGTVHTRSLDGSNAVRQARKQAVQFNALARASAPPAADRADDPAARLRRLRELLDSGLLTQAEYDAKKAEIIKSI